MIKASAFGVSPYVSRKGSKIGGIDIFLLNILQDKLEFKVELKWASNWGRKTPNGSWTGTIGDVQKGQSQIGLGHLALASNRFQVIDYTHFLYVFKISLMTRRPVIQKPFWKLFEPMDVYSWSGFIFTSFVFSFFIKMWLICCHRFDIGVNVSQTSIALHGAKSF